MNGSLFSITRYMNGVCFKVSGGTSVPKLPPSYPPPPPSFGTAKVISGVLVPPGIAYKKLLWCSHWPC